ncbi:MAG: glycerate kinase [Treponema sp.]|nr:glycerate kinase [Treponema sp.]
MHSNIINSLHIDAKKIIDDVIKENQPQEAVREALQKHKFSKNIYLLAIGKAAWTMAQAAERELGERIKKGIVITKYDHSRGDLQGMEIIEAGHPISDENTLTAAEKAIEMAQNLGADDELLFLISGGGSALFEYPLEGLTLDDIKQVNSMLLACGADIIEINMIRKRLSRVKAGRFAQICSPAKVFTVALSDVLGDKLDSIASGPSAPDSSTVQDAMNVIDKYKLDVSRKILEYLKMETPKSLDNAQYAVTGSVRKLCESAARAALKLGYAPHVLCAEMNCEAREAGRFISSIAKEICAPCGGDSQKEKIKKPYAVIFGGETVVTLKGNGKGGRNQELVLSAAEGIAGLENILVFSLSSDGTDGPTDAAGGIADGASSAKLKEKGLSLRGMLDNNDSYNALCAIGGLIKTGPTGTNVNDVTVILAK